MADGLREARVSEKLLPPEGDGLRFFHIYFVVVILPYIDVVAVCNVVAVCDVIVPERCLPAVVQPLALSACDAVFIQMCAQPVAVNVQRELRGEEIVDERCDVDVSSVSVVGVGVVCPGERRLHLEDGVVYAFPHLCRHLFQVVGVGAVILVVYIQAVVGVAEDVLRVVGRGIVYLLVVAVYLHMEVTGEVASVFTRIVQIEAVFPFAGPFGEDEHAVIHTVEHHLAESAVRHVCEERPGEFEGEHVAYHRLVGEWREEHPVVVFPHAEERDFRLLPAVF